MYLIQYSISLSVLDVSYRNCWPILDKKQESSFRKVAVGWLNRISKVRKIFYIYFDSILEWTKSGFLSMQPLFILSYDFILCQF